MLRTITILLVWLGTATLAIGQQINGNVTDAESKRGLPGVSIKVMGTDNGTSATEKGRFSLSVPSMQDTLVFSYVGYERKVVPIKGRSRLNVRLKQKTVQSEELVVVGYGEAEEKDVTGSISRVDPEDGYTKGVSSSADQLIGNKVPGVRFVQGSNLPGSNVEINIRGSSSIHAGTNPLYVVDGVPINKTNPITSDGNSGFTNSRTSRNPLNRINPSNIESIEILKDASATAIYGNRGANGVVLITTKRGRRSDMQINIDSYAGIQTIGNRLDLLEPQEYKRVINGIIEDGGGNSDMRVSEIANDGRGTDWQDVAFRDNAVVSSNNISFSGGGEEIQYFTSLNYFTQDGIVKNSSLDRYTARLNLDYDPSSTLNMGLNVNSSYVKDRIIPHGFQFNVGAGLIQSAYKFDPTLPERNENGELVTSQQLLIDNPGAILQGESSTSNTYNTFGNVFAEYFVLPQLSAKLKIGGDVASQRRDTFVGSETIAGEESNGIATIMDGSETSYLIEGTVNYKEDLKIHSIDAVFGASYQRFLSKESGITGKDFPVESPKTHNIGLSNPEFTNIRSSTSSNNLISYIGRVNYTLDDAYLLTATFRADGSSRFAERNRFGYFPSGAVGWRISEEPFMEPIEFVSDLKLRASYGITGNQDIGNLQFATTFGQGPTGILGDQPVTTIAPSRLGNPDLKWEKTVQWDIGLDFGLFDERITGKVDYFDKKTEDMLMNLPVPTSTGYSSQLSNVGTILNNGFEFSLNTQNVSKRDFQWSTDVSFSTLNNEVKELGDIPEIITGDAGRINQIGIIREGAPMYSFYGWQIEGIWQEGDDFSKTEEPVEPGSIKYRDVNGDGKINAEDRVILGNSIPDYTWSVENTFNYKNFNLNVLIEGVEGISMLNANLADSYFPTALRRNKMAEPYLNRWTPENPSNEYPSFVNPNRQGAHSVNSHTVEDASYIRLKSVRLSYNIPVGQFSKMRSARVYVTGENLITISDYSGPDPAVNPNSNANFRIDWNSAPMATTFMVGLELGI